MKPLRLAKLTLCDCGRPMSDARLCCRRCEEESFQKARRREAEIGLGQPVPQKYLTVRK